MCRRPLLPLLALAALLALPPASHGLSCYSCSDLNTVQGADHPVVNAAGKKPPCSSFDPDNSTYKMEPCVYPFDASCIQLNYASGMSVRGCYNIAWDNCTVTEQLTECICTSDYCNNSAGLTAPALLLLLPAVLLAALYSRQ